MDKCDVVENKLSYKDFLQVDGAFAVAHINYGKTPIFNRTDGKDIAKQSRKNSLSSRNKIDNVLDKINVFNGTEKDYKKDDRISLWKNYWLEYINAFNNLVDILPNSIVTIYVGRHAIEIGLKYLLLIKTGKINKTHDLGVLSKLLYETYSINDDYMNDIEIFCEKYCEYIEGGNTEYLKFPEYKENTFFAGNKLDIKWIAFNFTLVLLKLIHFANLDDEI